MTKKSKRNRSTAKISTKPEVQSQNRHYDWLTGIEDLLIILIAAVALLLFSPSLLSDFTLPKITALAVLISLLSIVFIYRISTGLIHPLPRLLWFPLLALILWWLIATTQAVYPLVALEGEYGRYNGLYTSLLLTGMFFIVSALPMDQKRIKRLSVFLLILVLPVLWYAAIQYLGLDPIFKGGFGSRPSSTVGNPVALATILLMFFPFLVVETLRSEDILQKAVFLFLLVILLTVTLITASRGPWLGFVACTGCMIIFLLCDEEERRRWLNPRVLLAVGVVVSVAVLVIVISPISERFTLGRSFAARLLYFSVALEAIKDSPFFGHGFESFRLIYPAYRPEGDIAVNQDVTPTMVHNDYLQIFLDNGFFALLFYLMFMTAVMWLMFKQIRTGSKTQRTLYIAMLGMLTGYLAAGLSVWPEAGSIITFWLVLAICTAHLINSSTFKPSTGYTNSIYMAVTSILLVIALYNSVVMVGNTRIDYLMERAKVNNSKANFKVADEYISRIDPRIQNKYYYLNNAGWIYVQRLFRTPDISTYNLARKYLLRARELNPFDAYIRIQLMETDIFSFQRKIITTLSEEGKAAMQEAIRIDPNNPTVYRVSAMFATLLGDSKLARQYQARMNEINSHK